MALADSVPGVSGGTIAFILGFYDDLLRALQGLFKGKGHVLRQRLRDTLGQEYCQQHGLEFTKVNPPEQMTEYVEQYLDGLLQAHRSEIKYY